MARPKAPTYRHVAGQMEAQGERSAQRRVAEAVPWLLAKKNIDDITSNTRAMLEQLGFKIVGEEESLFFAVTPPDGWTKSTEGYWTEIKDTKKQVVLKQFYKGAILAESAFIRRLVKGTEVLPPLATDASPVS